MRQNKTFYFFDGGGDGEEGGGGGNGGTGRGGGCRLGETLSLLVVAIGLEVRIVKDMQYLLYKKLGQYSYKEKPCL